MRVSFGGDGAVACGREACPAGDIECDPALKVHSSQSYCADLRPLRQHRDSTRPRLEPDDSRPQAVAVAAYTAVRGRRVTYHAGPAGDTRLGTGARESLDTRTSLIREPLHAGAALARPVDARSGAGTLRLSSRSDSRPYLKHLPEQAA